MRHLEKHRWLLFAAIASLAAALSSGVAIAVPDDVVQLLKQADTIKSADNTEFVKVLARVESDSGKLTPQQRFYLKYLEGWQAGYAGNYSGSVSQLTAVIDQSDDPVLQFRAGISVVNVLSIASRDEEAYSQLSKSLELLPNIRDPEARQQGLSVAAQLYNLVGQYDLAQNYADKLINENPTARGACTGWQLKLSTLYKSQKYSLFREAYSHGFDACVKAKEPVWLSLLRVDAARIDIAQDRPADAIKRLKDGYDEVATTHYPRVISAVDAVLAQAYWKMGEIKLAQQYATKAVDGSIKNEFTEPLVDASFVLYQIAAKKNDYKTALMWHEKFAVADKGFRSDISSRTLAFEMVNQQVAAKKLQIDSLNKRNQVLTLQQQVARKSSEARGLYIALLLVLLGSLIFWGYRTKRSQVRFRQQAQRDGLTGIFNRQHFIDVAEDALKYCGKSGRDASVIVIDLDNFKLVNDAHGHAAGDVVLCRAVEVILSNLRSVDVFGRLGGEEFGIVLPYCELDQSRVLAETLRAAISGLKESDAGPDFPVSASFGIATTRTSGYELRQLLAHADNALYQAKRGGRNRVETFVPATELPEDERAGQLDRRRS